MGRPKKIFKGIVKKQKDTEQGAERDEEQHESPKRKRVAMPSPASSASSSKRGRPRKATKPADAARPIKSSQKSRGNVDSQQQDIEELQSVSLPQLSLQGMSPVVLPQPQPRPATTIIADHCLISERDVQQLQSNDRLWMDEASVYAFVCSVARRCGRRVCVVSPHFTAALHNENAMDLSTSARQVTYGDCDRAEVIVVIVLVPGHFTLAIHEVNSRTIRFFDSRFGVDRLSQVLRGRLEKAVRDIRGRECELEVRHPDNAQEEVNYQHDGEQCGVHVCLMAESYLMNDRVTFLHDFDVLSERRRILRHLELLCHDDDCEYVSRPLRLRPVPERRSVRIVTVRNTSPEPHVVQPTTQRGHQTFQPRTQRCHQLHAGFGCAAECANHLPDYYSSGKFGDKTCTFCNALLLKSEDSTKCCAHGRIRLPPWAPLTEPFISLHEKEPLLPGGKEFRQHQKAYNSMMAFASVRTGSHAVPHQGAQVCLLNGEFHLAIGDLLPAPNQTPVFLNVYFLSTEEAVQTRASTVDSRVRFSEDLVRLLHTALLEAHPLARACLQLKEQYDAIIQQGGEVPQVRLTLLNRCEVSDENIAGRELHDRQINLPTGDDVCAVWVSNDGEPPELNGFVIKLRTGGLKELPVFHPLTDSCCYPLLFPNGESGYHFGIRIHRAEGDIRAAVANEESETGRSNNNSVDAAADDENADVETRMTREFVSCRQYYRYRLQMRRGETHHHIYNMGRLTQTYVIHASFKVDHQRNEWAEKTSKTLRVAGSEAFRAFLESNLRPGETLGNVLIARSTVPGSRAYYRKQFFAAMAIFREVGAPQIFLTWTMDPKCEEMREALDAGETSGDAPHKIVRMFIDKVLHLRDAVENKRLFGRCTAYLESLEYQKRGGPHIHKLIRSEDIRPEPAVVDQYIKAEIPPIPDRRDTSPWAIKMRLLRPLVIKHQIHKCGDWCTVDGRCSKGFPKPFCQQTKINEDRPCEYLRRSPLDGGASFSETVRRDGANVPVEFNNSHVVAYNPDILLTYKTHHNVEYVYGQHHAKYAVKYPLKGGSYAYVRHQSSRPGEVDYNEYRMLQLANYRSAAEAYMRIHSYPIVRLSHTCHILPVHLPRDDPVIFDEGEEEAAAWSVQRGTNRISKLSAFFNLCRDDPSAADLMYVDVAKGFHFKDGEWKQRKRILNVVCRILPVPPRYLDLFALRLLMCHVVGPTSFEHLRTVEGQTHRNFIDAARALGLMTDDDIWDRTLTEAARDMGPREMRNLFVQILLFGTVTDARKLWEKFESEFYRHQRPLGDVTRRHRINMALLDIERRLSYFGKCCKDFGLPEPPHNVDLRSDDEVERYFFPYVDNVEYGDQPDAVVADYVTDSINFYNKLNVEQRAVVDVVERAMNAPVMDETQPRLFFLLGSGGTGKTFVYNTLVYRCMSRHRYVLPTASTGIAATLLFNGVTAHSTFRLGINVGADTVASIAAESATARRLQKAELIIIDEVSVLHRFVLEAIDRTLRSIAPQQLRKLPFGGKVILLGGDWKQLLPIVTGVGSNVVDQVKACVKSSRLFQFFSTLELKQNMRTGPGEQEFTKLLEDLGRGQNFVSNTDRIQVPREMQVNNLRELIDFVYEGVTALDDIRQDLSDRLLLAPINKTVDKINAEVLTRLQGTARLYLSADASVDDHTFEADAALHDVEQLNRLNPSGFPPHQLELKVHTVVVLLRNVDIRSGLCNGTRLVVERLGEDLLYCRPLTGMAAQRGDLVMLPRFSFEYQDSKPDGTRLHFRRLQFPVRPAFCMTINKAQGQTASRVGIALETESFSAGQIYVAFSRVRTAASVKVLLPPPGNHPSRTIRNVVATGLHMSN